MIHRPVSIIHKTFWKKSGRHEKLEAQDSFFCVLSSSSQGFWQSSYFIRVFVWGRRRTFHPVQRNWLSVRFWCYVWCIVEILVNFIVFLSLACNCNPEGSLDVSCNEYGECNCKFGVLGIKCDSCEENKHNLTAGCVSKYCLRMIRVSPHGEFAPALFVPMNSSWTFYFEFASHLQWIKEREIKTESTRSSSNKWTKV